MRVNLFEANIVKAIIVPSDVLIPVATAADSMPKPSSAKNNQSRKILSKDAIILI